jgi:hypothetical protein
MHRDKPTHEERLLATSKHTGRTEQLRGQGSDGDDGEGSCAAFGYLRGIRDQAVALEFRFLDGNSVWFPYGWLGTWSYNPSEGILLKFSGDLVYLVLIRGSNLDKPLNDAAIDLTHAGLQRHRVLWVREMTREDVGKVGEAGPTIDTIDIAEFESHSDLKVWLANRAPGFVHETDH